MIEEMRVMMCGTVVSRLRGFFLVWNPCRLLQVVGGRPVLPMSNYTFMLFVALCFVFSLLPYSQAH